MAKVDKARGELVEATPAVDKLLAILRICQKMNSVRDLSILLDLIAREATRLLEADRASIFLLDRQKGELWSKVALGSDEVLRFDARLGIAGAVVHTDQIFNVDEAQHHPQFYPGIDTRTGYHTRSLLATPLRTPEGETIGAFEVLNKHHGSFTEADEEIVKALAAQTAVAINNVQLLEESRTRQARLEALLGVSSQLSRIQPLESLLADIAKACGQLLSADSVGVGLLQGDDLVLTGTWGGPREMMPRARLKLGESLAGIVAATGDPLVVRNPADDPRLIPEHQEAYRRLGVKAFLGVPVKVGEHTVGVLIIRSRSIQGFAPDDIAVAMAFASQVAIALQNSCLYGELQVALKEVEASQQQRVRAERLRALGEMAAGVAHDFNNLLAIIIGRAEHLLGRVKESELIRELAVVRNAALDGAQTVRRIQEFTRTRQTRPFGQVDLRELLVEVVELTRPRWEAEAGRRGITYEVRVEGEPTLSSVGTIEELREVFMNLLINALEAMPSGGRFTFRGSTEGKWVVVRAEDIGCGMPEEARRRVFEPFFTTKGSQGTGLGLAVAWGIVTRHEGTIEVASTPGKGSTFTVRLPLRHAMTLEQKPTASPEPPRPARVLLIEDESEVRAVLSNLLAGEGHTVLEAAGGAEGLARFEVEPVDLVLTDLSMPGMSGWKVAAACHARFPRVPIGFITGWGDQLDPEELERHGVRFVLAKPFVLNDLLRQLAEVLDPRKRD
jgi:signal transduction histidine kinase/ActR/RegA family two-component response regulator